MMTMGVTDSTVRLVCALQRISHSPSRDMVFYCQGVYDAIAIEKSKDWATQIRLFELGGNIAEQRIKQLEQRA